MLRRVAIVRTDVSEELSASFIRVARLDELGTTLVVSSNRRTLPRNTMVFLGSGCYLQLVMFLVHRFLSPWWRRRYVPPKRRFLQEPRGLTSQMTPFFTSNLTYYWLAGICSWGMCFLWGMNWILIFQNTAFFIVIAMKTSDLIQILYCYKQTTVESDSDTSYRPTYFSLKKQYKFWNSGLF
jgi:hypothetical protein